MAAIFNRNSNKAEIPDSPGAGLRKLSGMLDIPPTATPGITQIELGGNREAVVDGCQGVLEYDENAIKLLTGKMQTCFLGRGLQIKVLTHDSAVIEGFIMSIEFIT